MGKIIEANEDIRIIEHNPYWIVVNKPAPLISHPTPKKIEPSLSELIREKATLLGYEVDKISLINRLDRETSGIVLIAIKKEASRIFGKAMVRKKFQKTYRALVKGHIAKDHLIINEPIIAQNEVSHSDIWVKQIVHPSGKVCTTEIKTLERLYHNSNPYSYIELKPTTGRMHQLRVHCAHIGHPILGDKLYNAAGRHYLDFIETGWNKEMEDELTLKRQALHATELSYGDDIWQWKSPFPVELSSFPSL